MCSSKPSTHGKLNVWTINSKWICDMDSGVEDVRVCKTCCTLYSGHGRQELPCDWESCGPIWRKRDLHHPVSKMCFG